MGTPIGKDTCDAKMSELRASIGHIENDIGDIKRVMNQVPTLCQTVNELMEWKKSFWRNTFTTVISTMLITTTILTLILKLVRVI